MYSQRFLTTICLTLISAYAVYAIQVQVSATPSKYIVSTGFNLKKTENAS